MIEMLFERNKRKYFELLLEKKKCIDKNRCFLVEHYQIYINIKGIQYYVYSFINIHV